MTALYRLLLTPVQLALFGTLHLDEKIGVRLRQTMLVTDSDLVEIARVLPDTRVGRGLHRRVLEARRMG